MGLWWRHVSGAGVEGLCSAEGTSAGWVLIRGGLRNVSAVVVEAGQHEVVPDLLWDEVKGWFDPEINGVLPDVRVEDTSIADWQAVLDLVRSAGWPFGYAVGGRAGLLPARAADMLGRPGDETVELRVWPAEGMLAIFRMYEVEQIEFDVDLRELQGQDRLDLLCEFLRVLGRKLVKPVVVTAEGCPDDPLLGFVPAVDRVVVLASERP